MANRVAWVSGASSGLGAAAARALKESGWKVVSGARSFSGQEGETDLGALLPLDVREEASVIGFAHRAAALYGPPDALVNAAGILTLGPVEDTTPEEVQKVLDTILLGTLRVTRAALPLMRENGGGKVVMLSSVNGLMPTPFQGAYVAAKHALEGLSECLALETRGQGIQVMLVEPGDHAGGSQRYRGRAQVVSPVYEDSYTRVRAVVARDEAGGGCPAAFGRKLARVLARKRLPARLRVTKIQETAAIVLHDILPGRLFQRFLASYYKV